MQISVILEPIDSQGFRATSFVPSQLVTEAPTREEALTKMRDLVSSRLSKAELVELHVPLTREPHPWLAVIGKLKDHPDAVEVEENIREYRRQVDQDPDRL